MGYASSRPLRERFWAKVQKTQGCWLWTGGRYPGGLGRVYVGGGRDNQRQKPAHVLAFEFTNGALAANEYVRHICRTPLCTRPTHLEATCNRTEAIESRNAPFPGLRHGTCAICGEERRLVSGEVCNRCWMANWRCREPERVQAIQRKSYKKRRQEGSVRLAESQRMSTSRYQSRKRGLPSTLTADEWEEIKAQFRYQCAYCGGTSELLVRDHVVPVRLEGGLTKENIVPACARCNKSKGGRTPEMAGLELRVPHA